MHPTNTERSLGPVVGAVVRHLDIVPRRIENKRSIIVRSVMRSHSRRTIALAPSLNTGLMEPVHSNSICSMSVNIWLQRESHEGLELTLGVESMMAVGYRDRKGSTVF